MLICLIVTASRTLEITLQRDDGWQSMGGEEQALLYTLEEISGSDYCLREDALGGSQVRKSGRHGPRSWMYVKVYIYKFRSVRYGGA